MKSEAFGALFVTAASAIVLAVAWPRYSRRVEEWSESSRQRRRQEAKEKAEARMRADAEKSTAA